MDLRLFVEPMDITMDVATTGLTNLLLFATWLQLWTFRKNESRTKITILLFRRCINYDYSKTGVAKSAIFFAR